MKKGIINLFFLSLIFVLLVTSCVKLPIPPTGGTEVPTELPTETETATPVIEGGSPTETPELTETPTPEAEPDEPGSYSAFLPFLMMSVADVGGPLPTPPPAGNGDWATVAGNPQRTSWSSEEVRGNQLSVEWYRPIEAYISPNVQLIATQGLIFVATSRGLYALNAYNGQEEWRFDTELPLGNSPTVVNGVLYVGGYDHKLYALRASDGAFLWSFDGAGAGYSTNPLVVDGKVLLGNRDGYFYAIGAHGTAQQGKQIWRYQTDGFIDLTAAYADGVVYFASNDNYAYALRSSDGRLVWKSDLLPGDGYGSFWPVVYGDTVVFSAASGYRTGMNPGSQSVLDRSGNPYGRIFDIDRDGIFGTNAIGTLIGSQVNNQTWSSGKQVLDVSRVTNYLEAGNHDDRRTLIVLKKSDGSEYTFDSDGDGKAEYAPSTATGTQSGNRYPPVVGPDGILYFSAIYQNFSIPQVKLMGWRIGTKYMSLAGGQGAIDEPSAISIGGNTFYRNLCCDRVGDWFALNANQAGAMWKYDSPLSVQIQGYDQMWYGTQDGESVRLRGNYGTVNGIYHNHGDQNPIIPYQGNLYVHRSNAIISYGTSVTTVEQPLLRINEHEDDVTNKSQSDYQQKLGAEIQEMITAGHLRPGYTNNGQFSNYSQLYNYFENPGETLLVLSRAYPYVPASLQPALKQYLIEEFDLYFNPIAVTKIGWRDGAAREWMPLPKEVQSALDSIGPVQGSDPRFSWPYPPLNFYALWKYALIVPEDVQAAYALAKNKLAVPVPSQASNDYLFQRPFEHNAYIAGYIGFLELQTLAGKTQQDSALRTQVTNELNRLKSLRSQTFSKDTVWQGDNGSYHLRTLNISRNFIYLVPELGDYLNQNIRSKIVQALDEYNSVAPFWFVARYNATVNEGVRQNLYDYAALFQAYAYILDYSAADLEKYLDVPAFDTGDLFYIQNLVALIDAY
jgi:outer membrane protein assembly factor BamB